MRNDASTPNDIEILIHFYCSRTPHPRRGAEAVDYTIRRFLQDKILRALDEPQHYEVTEKGLAWLIMILNTPYPVQVWATPEGERIEVS